jgi:hypothetical protein
MCSLFHTIDAECVLVGRGAQLTAVTYGCHGNLSEDTCIFKAAVLLSKIDYCEVSLGSVPCRNCAHMQQLS